MAHLTIVHSAYNGINVTQPEAPVVLRNCTLRNNRGYGIYVNSSSGLAQLQDCHVLENGADGIRYVHHDIVDAYMDRKDIYDFCQGSTTSSQTFPITVSIEQSKHLPTSKECRKDFQTRPGHLLTLHFVYMWTDRNDSAVMDVFDGPSVNDRLLGSVKVRNGTKPQSITTSRHRVYIRFRAQPRTQTIVMLELTSGYRKSYDLNVTGSLIADNNGRGVAIENLHSQLHVHQSAVSNNNHVAGVHVQGGVGDVNISDSRISFNHGDGVNVSYVGGNRNITRSWMSSNKGYGIAIWFNESEHSPYLAFNQTTVLSFTEIFRNDDIGFLVGNYSHDSYVNVTENRFNDSLETAVQIETSWRRDAGILRLQIGHNQFVQNGKLGIKLSPALNLQGRVEYNYFTRHSYGCMLIRNKFLEEFDVLPARLALENNVFEQNHGVYVVSLGLSPYSEVQHLLFTRNFVRDNRIREPFETAGAALVPRSRVAAPLVVGSSNVDVYRNILQNPESPYEIGSHLEDQSLVINCTYNWLGDSTEEKIYPRLFHRKDRYNLAKLEYLPFLLHSSNPSTTLIMTNRLYVPQFLTPGSNQVGGEVDGLESLRAGEYVVERDINVRPGGKLSLQPGVTLRFPPSVGMMVAGKLDARGARPNDIRFTLKEERVDILDNGTEEVVVEESKVPVRLLGGRTTQEGRLQVLIRGVWGTVCNYGWTMRDAALVCHQLGLVLNPDDWFLERFEIPNAGTSENIILSNVRCTEDDFDLTQCRAERADQFENSCSHDNDVGLRCSEPSWAGVRLGVLAEQADLQYITVEQAGLLDYATNTFKAALQVDFARHSLENVRVVNNYQDGLGVLYSDLYSTGASNTVKNSEFSHNMGSGISFKQLGLKVSGSSMNDNKMAGIRHNPALSAQQQRELAGWFRPPEDTLNSQYAPYRPLLLPATYVNLDLNQGETRYFLTERVQPDPIDRSFYIKCKPGFVIGIQLLNPIHNRSTEEITVYNSQTMSKTAKTWSLRRDLVVFPVVSSSYGIVLDYKSGTDALGGAVLVLSVVEAPVQDIKNRIVTGPVPTLSVTKSIIKGNKYGVYAAYYNRYLNEMGDHFLRKANETMKFVRCDISYNTDAAIFVYAPFWDVYASNVSEIRFMINDTLIADNGRGIHQFSRDLRNSNNLFHWVLQDNTIERNAAGGFDVSLPYVWQYNENLTHSIYLANNTWRNNKQFAFVVDGHFAQVNVTHNLFEGNECKTGLVSMRGMEKKMLLVWNRIEGNAGSYMVEFQADSQSEILGEVSAVFMWNQIKNNRFSQSAISRGFLQVTDTPSFVVGFRGTQKVRVNRNLFGNNALAYELLAGVGTARVDNFVNVVENWWGSADVADIKSRIFDFDDWNNHAVATFRPYLMEDNLEASISVSWDQPTVADLDNLGGRLRESLVLHQREHPYSIRADVTVMPGVTLSIAPGVVLEFAPNVGILVLGTLRAQGRPGQEIVMRPGVMRASLENKVVRRSASMALGSPSIRLCTGRNCTSLPSLGEDFDGSAGSNEGFLEYYNRTTLQWVPICDDRFTERNAQVVCRELGYQTLNVYFDRGLRVELHPNSLSRIWSWPEPLQCRGDEGRLEDCAIRLNGQLYGHRHSCAWNSDFVFIHCGEGTTERASTYWGGIRFANGQFEQNLYEYRIHDVVTHQTMARAESVVEFVNMSGAGILHNEKSPAILSVARSPAISNVNISHCASHGISLISPVDTTRLLANRVEHTLGVGIAALSLTGEGRESDESSFTPLKEVHVPYHLFSVIDMCDTAKEIMIEERVLVYFKYDNNPVNCVKIFNSVAQSKPFGFRLLQFNLFNSTGKPGRADGITLYDGDIYNLTSKVIGHIEVGNSQEKKMFRTRLPSLSVKLFANGASNVHGFIAEIVTLPISAIGFNRDVQHNISFSTLINNREGAVHYSSAGEVNPMVTMEWNQITRNCAKLYGNFTTCQAAVYMDIQNTQTIYFRNNLVKENQGGLTIKVDSRGSATTLNGWICNNLFTDNVNNPALLVEGRQSSPYQKVTLFRNYFTRNICPYRNVIILKQVVSNFTYNYVHYNWGRYILEVSGFEKVRLQIYQTTSHNGFYKNFAVDREAKGTIIAGTAGQQYIDNVLFNPDNDYEIVTVNRSFTQEVWRARIDAKHNWWGYNETLAVMGRIRDRLDTPDLLEVDFQPFHMNNRSILSGKCPPGWQQVGDTCYIYIGAPMNFEDARSFCRSVNASMPYVMGNYLGLYQFLREQQQGFQYYDHVWVQHIDKVNRCTMFAFQKIEVEHCNRLNPFLCEIDPKVLIDPLSWRDDIVTVAVIGTVGVALLLVALAAGLWYSKSKHRRIERLQRRNSIRQSLHSVRSVGLGSSHAGFSELGFRRKVPQGQHSSPTLTRGADYKKMNGSIDSIDKSQFNSSVEDNRSYDIYEAHNPNASSTFNFSEPSGEAVNPRFDLAFRNEGFRDNSTFTSRDDWTPDENLDYLNNSSTLPLDTSLAMTDSTLDMKSGLDVENQQARYQPRGVPVLPPEPPEQYQPSLLDTDNYKPRSQPKFPHTNAPYQPSLLETDLDFKQADQYQPSLLETDLDFKPAEQYPPNLLETDLDYDPVERPRSEALLDTDFGGNQNLPPPPARSKSEVLLETNLDSPVPTHQAMSFNRSKSQPLETAM